MFNFTSFNFHVEPYLCRPKQDVVFKDKAVNISFQLVGRRAFVRTQQQKTMSSLPHHDDDCNAGDMVSAQQTTDHPLNNVDTADPMEQTRELINPNPLRTKQEQSQNWMQTLPVLDLQQNTKSLRGTWQLCYPRRNLTWCSGGILVLAFTRSFACFMSTRISIFQFLFKFPFH